MIARPALARVSVPSAVFASVLALAGAAPAQAEILLTLTGADGETTTLSRKELEAMPQVSIATETEFTDGIVTFRGPLAREVLDTVEVGSDDIVRFTAANDYYVDIPVSDFEEYDVILAMSADGTELSLRDKGPLWLIYPFSDHRALADPIYIARLIWQVIAVEVL